jgi:hypothetical protein
MKRETVAEIWVFVMLVAVGVGMRVMSNSLELWNFAPVTAAALFAGYFLSRRSVAVAVPLLVMVISNAVLDLPYGSGAEMACIYGAMTLPVLLRGIVRRKYNAIVIGGCASASSISFFVISNFAFWYFSGHLQEPQLSLWQTYVAGLPFFKYTLASDLAWTGVFFGSYSLAAQMGIVPAVHAEVKVPTGAGINPAAR